MLTIGEFSRICFVTRKTLRHYDEIGLLRPEHIAENGYRYYKVEQLRTMLLINRLKGYGFSLPEISAVLASPDSELLSQKLMEKRQTLMQSIENTTRILKQLDEDMEKSKRRIDIMQTNMDVKTVVLEPQKVYGVRKRIAIKDFQELFSQLFAETSQKGVQPIGGPMTFYHEADFNPEDSDIEVGVPVATGETHMVPGGEACFVTLLGAYETEKFTAAYTELMRWVDANGYCITGAPMEKYVRGGIDCPPEENVTEIYFPIEKVK